jgi:hypothetical protein
MRNREPLDGRPPELKRGTLEATLGKPSQVHTVGVCRTENENEENQEHMKKKH